MLPRCQPGGRGPPFIESVRIGRPTPTRTPLGGLFTLRGVVS